MTTATQTPELPFVVSADRFAEHQADLARRQKEREAKAPLLRACLDPKVAAAKEAEKPVFEYRVKANFDLMTTGEPEAVEMDERVFAQNERDAWSLACDKLQVWPSIRVAKPTFKRGRQVSVADITAGIEAESSGDKPRRKLTAKKTTKQNL